MQEAFCLKSSFIQISKQTSNGTNKWVYNNHTLNKTTTLNSHISNSQHILTSNRYRINSLILINSHFKHKININNSTKLSNIKLSKCILLPSSISSNRVKGLDRSKEAFKDKIYLNSLIIRLSKDIKDNFSNLSNTTEYNFCFFFMKNIKNKNGIYVCFFFF